MKDTLYIILKEISQHKEDNMESIIQERLESALMSYIHSLDASSSYLNDRNSLNLLKRLSKK